MYEKLINANIKSIFIAWNLIAFQSGLSSCSVTQILMNFA